MAFMKICRRLGCSASVEEFTEDYWSDQCEWHNDADSDERREYAEDESRYRDELDAHVHDHSNEEDGDDADD